MPNLIFRITIVMAIAASVTPMLSSACWAQTRAEMSEKERAAGIEPSPAQRKAEDRELRQLDQSLIRQEQPSPPAPPR
jgi:hypothetical protein